MDGIPEKQREMIEGITDVCFLSSFDVIESRQGGFCSGIHGTDERQTRRVFAGRKDRPALRI